MEKTEILKEAIKKAKGNGYEGSLRDTILVKDAELITGEYYAILFDNDFAKAFFGINAICWGCKKSMTEEDYFKHTKDCDAGSGMNYEWEHGLHSMSTEEEPLDYIGQILRMGGLEKIYPKIKN